MGLVSRRPLLALGAALLGVWAGIDAGTSVHAQPFSQGRGADFDFYVLSLSWSPGFCQTGGAEKARSQCAPGARRGFVVHGLWPQYQRGFPSDCANGRPAPQDALDAAAGLYPEDRLARYEWRKHGTCTGLGPREYFIETRRARDLVTQPSQFSDLRQDNYAAPSEILRWFMEVNPRLSPGMAAVTCKDGALSEVRFCLSKDLRSFTPCPQVARASCRAPKIRIPAPL